MTARLLDAIDSYAREFPWYDDVFVEVHDRIAGCGSAGKFDIAALTTWKRSAQGRWVGKLLNTQEPEVRAATQAAFAAGGDAEALKALSILPGFRRQEVMSTALLSAWNPQDFGVMDRRALAALDSLGRPVERSQGLTLRYLKQVRNLRDELTSQRAGVTARDIDKGLYMLGRKDSSGG